MGVNLGIGEKQNITMNDRIDVRERKIVDGCDRGREKNSGEMGGVLGAKG